MSAGAALELQGLPSPGIQNCKSCRAKPAVWWFLRLKAACVVSQNPTHLDEGCGGAHRCQADIHRFVPQGGLQDLQRSDQLAVSIRRDASRQRWAGVLQSRATHCHPRSTSHVAVSAAHIDSSSAHHMLAQLNT